MRREAVCQESAVVPEVHMLEEFRFSDDGLVPNNPALPLRFYRSALSKPAANSGARRAEAAIISRFAENGWGGAWIDGIYPFHHYHARSHEVLGMARGWADVQFGGQQGPVIRLTVGDAVLIPAGVAHRCHDASVDLSVVGAYPPGQEDWDLKRPTLEVRALALREIAAAALPLLDPVLGLEPPWRQDRSTARAP